MTDRPDPVTLMLAIAQRFLEQAADLDERTEDAINADASQGDIIALRNLADTSRLRALAACAQAAPYCSPKLSAVELAPMTEPTKSRFDQRLEAMSEDEVLDHLKRIAAGTTTIALLEGDVENTFHEEGDETVGRPTTLPEEIADADG